MRLMQFIMSGSVCECNKMFDKIRFFNSNELMVEIKFSSRIIAMSYYFKKNLLFAILRCRVFTFSKCLFNLFFNCRLTQSALCGTFRIWVISCVMVELGKLASRDYYYLIGHSDLVMHRFLPLDSEN